MSAVASDGNGSGAMVIGRHLRSDTVDRQRVVSAGIAHTVDEDPIGHIVHAVPSHFRPLGAGASPLRDKRRIVAIGV